MLALFGSPHLAPDLGPRLAYVVPQRGLMSTQVAHILADVGPILALGLPLS